MHFVNPQKTDQHHQATNIPNNGPISPLFTQNQDQIPPYQQGLCILMSKLQQKISVQETINLGFYQLYLKYLYDKNLNYYYFQANTQDFQMNSFLMYTAKVFDKIVQLNIYQDLSNYNQSGAFQLDISDQNIILLIQQYYDIRANYQKFWDFIYGNFSEEHIDIFTTILSFVLTKCQFYMVQGQLMLQICIKEFIKRFQLYNLQTQLLQLLNNQNSISFQQQYTNNSQKLTQMLQQIISSD